MKTVRLEKRRLNLKEAMNMADKEPVLLLTADGREFIISEADDFEKEVEILRKSHAFQKFLDKRAKSKKRISLANVEKGMERVSKQ